MASVPGGHETQSRQGHEAILTQAERAELLTETLGTHIRELTLYRQAAYGRADTYRREGQLVPGSLRDEITENAQQLRHALERYAEATQAVLPSPPRG